VDYADLNPAWFACCMMTAAMTDDSAGGIDCVMTVGVLKPLLFSDIASGTQLPGEVSKAEHGLPAAAPGADR
jgi:hypothetical protein